MKILRCAPFCALISATFLATACTVRDAPLNTAANSANVSEIAAHNTQLETDIGDFVFAYCLRSLNGKQLPVADRKTLTEQGQRWTSVVIANSRGDPTKMFAMIPAIDAAIAETPMSMVRDEDRRGSLAAPVHYCANIGRQSSVMEARKAAVEALAPDYATAP